MGIKIMINVPFGTLNYGKYYEYRNAYCNALMKEIESYGDDDKLAVDAIIFTNGATTLLPLDKLVHIIEKLEDVFALSENCEIQVRSQVGYLKEAYFHELPKHGVNSLYMDVKAYDEATLEQLKMPYLRNGFELERDIIKKHDSVACEISFSLNVNAPNYLKELETLLQLEPERIDILGEDQEKMAAIKEYLKDYTLEDHTFTKPNARFKNRTFEEYIGIGIGMESILDGMRTINTNDFTTYLKYSEYPEKIIETIEKI